jgi:hypothetical protein
MSSYPISTIGDATPVSSPTIPAPVITVAGLVAGTALGALATWYLLYKRRRR